MKNFEMIEKGIEEHDKLILELAKSTETLKGQCEEIDEELDVHNYLLGRIEDLTGESEAMMEKASQRMEKLLGTYSNSSLACAIFILLLILIVLLAI